MYLRLISILAAITLLLTSCGGQSTGLPNTSNPTAAPTTREPLRVVTPFLSQPLDPARGGGFNAIQFGVGETLMRLDETFTPVPWLAVELTAVDPQTWQIRLREGATFHDGAPVDADSVKASLERAVAKSPGAAALLKLDQVTVVDPLTLRIKTAEPNPRLPGLLTEPSTVIVNAAAATAQGDDAFAQKPIMTGVFKVEQFTQDREAVLVRHEKYWGTPARSERVVISVQSDANARLLALQSGQADIAIDIRPEGVQVIERDADLKVVRAAPVATMFMYLNHRKPFLQDVRVRQALAYGAPPREQLVQTVLRGEGIPAVGPFPPYILECSDLKGYTQDLDRSRTLLAEAGFRDSDGDGIVERNGEPLRLTVLSYPQRPALTPMAEIIQASFREIGVAMEIRTVEQINDALANMDWDGGMYFNNMAATGDPFGSLVQFYTAEGASNRGGYRNTEIEAAIQALRTVEDRTERRARSCAISQQLLDDVAIIPLVYPNYSYGVSRKVVGFDTAHPYFLYFLNGMIGRQ